MLHVKSSSSMRTAICVASGPSARAHPALSLRPARSFASTSARLAEGDAPDVGLPIPPIPGQVVEEMNEGHPTMSTHFELGRFRRVTVSEWNGKPQIGVREWYPSQYTGELRPGTKGTALSLEEWKTLLDAAPEINRLVDGKKDELDQRAEEDQSAVEEREAHEEEAKYGRLNEHPS